MTEPEKAGLLDDNLKGHDSGLINEKFSDAPLENQPAKERELEADETAEPSDELQSENENRLKANKEIKGPRSDTHV